MANARTRRNKKRKSRLSAGAIVAQARSASNAINSAFPKARGPSYSPQSSLGVGANLARVNVLNSASGSMVTKNDSNLILQQLALPHDFVGLRWKDAYTSEPTAVFSPYDFVAAPFTSTNSDTGNLCTGGFSFAAVFRNPLRALVYYDPNPTNKGTNYVFQFTPTGGIGAPVTTWPMDDKGLEFFDPLYLTLGSGQAYAPHGPVLYAGSHSSGTVGKVTGIWIDATATHNSHIKFNGDPASSYAIIPYLLVGGTWNMQQGLIVQAVSGVAIVTIGKSGYYAFQFNSQGVNNDTFSFSSIVYYIGDTSSANGPNVACHLPCSAIVGNETLIPRIRVNAMSILVVNETADLYRGGMCAGCQVPGGTPWWDLAVGNTLTNLSSQNPTNVMQKDLRTGIYGFARPSDPSDFSYTDYFKVSFSSGSPILTGVDYPIMPSHDYLFVALSAQNTAPNTYPGGDVYIMASWANEFRTNNQLFTQLPASGLPTQYELALSKLSVMPQWHENPLHLPDILNFVKRAAGRTVDAAIQYGPTILSIAKLIKSGIMMANGMPPV